MDRHVPNEGVYVMASGGVFVFLFLGHGMRPLLLVAWKGKSWGDPEMFGIAPLGEG